MGPLDRTPSSSTGAARPANGITATTKATTAAATEVDIASLEQKYGWASGSWQDNLLKAADQTSGAPDGKVSAAKLDQYLANPTDLQFVTSTDMQKERADLAAGGNNELVSGFASTWEQNLAKKADANNDGKLTDVELGKYLDSIKSSTGKDFPTWLPDMKQANYDDKIAEVTGEVSNFMVGNSGAQNGSDANSPVLSEEYMKIQTDSKTRVPDYVTYQLSAADIAEKPASVSRDGDKTNPDADFRRANPFHVDPRLSQAEQVKPSDYNGSPFDQGHMRNALDSPNMEAMFESFTMANMSTQYHAVNEQPWACLEGAVNELVQQTGGSATIVTGNLYLDAKGNPLPPDQRQYYKPTDGSPPLAIPSACFKAVLLTKPDGTKQMFAYTCPNTADIPRTEEGYQPILRAGRTSVDALKKELGGVDLFSDTGISPAALTAMESDSTSQVIDPKTAATMNHGKVLWS